MRKQKLRSQPRFKTAIWLLFRIIVYTGFAAAYCFLVLVSIRSWLKETFDAHRVVYALIVLPLIIAQAVLLDFVTMVLRKAGSKKNK